MGYIAIHYRFHPQELSAGDQSVHIRHTDSRGMVADGNGAVFGPILATTPCPAASEDSSGCSYRNLCRRGYLLRTDDHSGLRL